MSDFITTKNKIKINILIFKNTIQLKKHFYSYNRIKLIYLKYNKIYI